MRTFQDQLWNDIITFAILSIVVLWIISKWKRISIKELLLSIREALKPKEE